MNSVCSILLQVYTLLLYEMYGIHMVATYVNGGINLQNPSVNFRYLYYPLSIHMHTFIYIAIPAY